MLVAIFTSLVVATILAFFWIAQERVVFQPPRHFELPREPDARRIDYRATDGQRLAGYLIGMSPHPDGLLVCFHGNADLSLWQCEWAEQVSSRTRHAVFLAEYRGYLGLGGQPSYETTTLDADAAFAVALEATGISAELISLFGHSLGSAVAAELAARQRVRRLLLQSPFTSAKAIARLVIGRPLLALWNRVSRVHFDTELLVAALDVPIFVIHGASDRVVPLWMGSAVYHAARRKGSFIVIPDAGHNDLPELGGEDYWSWISSALAGTESAPLKF